MNMNLVGEKNYHIVQRNSIRNLADHPSHETIAFHSSQVLKPIIVLFQLIIRYR